MKKRSKITALLLAAAVGAAWQASGTGAGIVKAAEEALPEDVYGGTLTLGEPRSNGSTIWKGIGCPQYYTNVHDRVHR